MSAIERATLSEAVQAAGRTGLAEVVARRHGGVVLALPPAVARDVLLSFVAMFDVRGAVVVDDPTQRVPRLGVLGPDRWAVRAPGVATRALHEVVLDDEWLLGPVHRGRHEAWWVFPRHCVRVRTTWESWVRRAVGLHVPEPLAPSGVPLPWVAAQPPTAQLGAGRDREDDIETVPAGAPHPALPPARDRPLDPDDDGSIRAAHRSVCALAGFGDVPLEVVRTTSSRDGFVEGRVWLSSKGPERVRVHVGPNADAAEVWATLLHELAHGLEPTGGHGPRFKRALVSLAEARFGPPALAAARRLLASRHALVDVWVVVCVRAALLGAPPPTEATGDEGQLARTVARIQKLRRLARSQLGRPEGRSACAKANDLLVRWDLGAYSVRLSEGIDEQMCDRWVDVGKRSVWRRQLAFAVAEYCGVFCLSRKSKGWMHFFGRYVDVVTAEWFYEIWHAHIERAADAHLAAYKQRCDRLGLPRRSRSERTNFCDSAVLALHRKLEALQAAHDAVAEPSETIATRHTRAEAFAGAQFALRGRGWSSGAGKSVTVNAAGMAAGRSAPMGRGVGGPTGVRGLLES